MILVPGAQSAEAAQKAVSGLVNAMPGEQYDRQEWFFEVKDSHDDNRRHNQKSYQDVKCFCHGYSHKRTE